MYKKRETADSEEILKKAQKSIFCVSALHQRYIYRARYDKEFISHLLGTAFMIKKGYALTDLSIVDQSKEIRLVNDEGKSLPCELIGKDHLYGIAVLKVKDEEPAFLPLRTSNPISNIPV